MAKLLKKEIKIKLLNLLFQYINSFLISLDVLNAKFVLHFLGFL